MHLQRRDLQHSLAEVLALKHANQALRRIVDAFGHTLPSLERPIVDPFLDVLLMLLVVLRAHVLVADLYRASVDGHNT